MASPSYIGQPDKQNMTAHRWFANKSCPGDYLYNRMGDIANKVNAILGSGSYAPDVEPDDESGVKDVQSWVNRTYGFGIEEDGIYGYYTRTALTKALQKELNSAYHLNLEVDGICGPMTKSNIPNIYNGCTGAIVRVLQALLICNGYSTNGFDGIFGDGTEKAVRDYQLDTDLETDGIAGRNTFSMLCNN